METRYGRYCRRLTGYVKRDGSVRWYGYFNHEGVIVNAGYAKSRYHAFKKLRLTEKFVKSGECVLPPTLTTQERQRVLASIHEESRP